MEVWVELMEECEGGGSGVEVAEGEFAWTAVIAAGRCLCLGGSDAPGYLCALSCCASAFLRGCRGVSRWMLSWMPASRLPFSGKLACDRRALSVEPSDRPNELAAEQAVYD